jgi:hypothetical protein
MGFFVGTNCPKIKLEIENFEDQLIKNLKCDHNPGEDATYSRVEAIIKANERDQDEHPFASERMNTLFFSNPKLRNALGCKTPTRYKHCE